MAILTSRSLILDLPYAYKTPRFKKHEAPKVTWPLKSINTIIKENLQTYSRSVSFFFSYIPGTVHFQDMVMVVNFGSGLIKEILKNFGKNTLISKALLSTQILSKTLLQACSNQMQMTATPSWQSIQPPMDGGKTVSCPPRRR